MPWPFNFAWYEIVFVLLVAAAFVAGGYLVYRSRQLSAEVQEDLAANGGQIVEMTPPNVRSERFGLMKTVREKRKKKRMLDKGYVQWYLIDDSFPRPQFVKPKRDESGVPKVEKGDETYLFPPHGRLPSEEQGMWTYVHRKGEADPVNLRDPDDLAIPADVLSEYLTMAVTSKPPGLLGGLGGLGLGDMDSMDLLRYTVVGMVLLFIGLEVSGGGLL